MYYTIYKITNKTNNKYYIGKHQTNNIDDGYMGSGKLLRRAINKHGINNFVKEILHIFDNEQDMNNKEKELVVIGEQSYNLCDGGKGGFGYINKLPNQSWRIKTGKITSQKLKNKSGNDHWKNISRLSHEKYSNLGFRSYSKKQQNKWKLLGSKNAQTPEAKEKRANTWKIKIQNGWKPHNWKMKNVKSVVIQVRNP